MARSAFTRRRPSHVHIRASAGRRGKRARDPLALHGRIAARPRSELVRYALEHGLSWSSSSVGPSLAQPFALSSR